MLSSIMFTSIRHQARRQIFQMGQLKLIKKWRSTVAIGPELSYRYYPGKLPLVDMTIGQLVDTAVEQWPNRECIVSAHQNLRLTFSEVVHRADKLAAGLKKLGLKRGDRVGVWGPNDLEWFLAFVAITRAGFVMVGINPAYQQNEVNYCAQKVGVSAIIASAKFRRQEYGNMLLSLKGKCPTLKHIILWSDNYIEGTHRFTDIESSVGKVEVEAIGASQNEISPNDACNIQFTSGTTGYPKAPLLSHRGFVNNGRQVSEFVGLPKDHHRVCMNLPFFHAYGMIQGCMAGFYSGCTLVLESPTFNPKSSIETIVREKCTVAHGTPTMWVNMIDVQERLQAPINSIRMGSSGGANVTPLLIKKVREVLNVEELSIVYGMTEVTGVIFQTRPGQDRELRENTVGRLHDNVEAMVVNDQGKPVPFGSPGELWIRGYCTMLGYWNDPENTLQTINDEGWLRTGDKFVLYDDGYGEIIGRFKDIIIRGGENIFPKEIESFYETHPDILEAHVFGVHDDVYGEEICACIRLRDDKTFTADEMISYAKGKIAHFKIPRYIQFLKEFPKTTSGKIQKFMLKREMESRGIVSA